MVVQRDREGFGKACPNETKGKAPIYRVKEKSAI